MTWKRCGRRSECLACRSSASATAVERRIPGLESGINMMPAGMDCASAASEARLAEIRKQEPQSAFGALANFPFPEICAASAIAPLSDTFREPAVTAIPALFVSGTLDSNTPPAQAERILRGFRGASHLIVENAGHESTLTPEVRERILAFMAGRSVADERLPGDPIRFDLPARTRGASGPPELCPAGKLQRLGVHFDLLALFDEQGDPQFHSGLQDGELGDAATTGVAADSTLT